MLIGESHWTRPAGVLNDGRQGEGGTLASVETNILYGVPACKTLELEENKNLMNPTWRPRRESNPHLGLRSALLCPLSYGGVRHALYRGRCNTIRAGQHEADEGRAA